MRPNTVAILAVSAVIALSALGQARVEITHESIDCIVRDTHALVQATFIPNGAVDGRVYFRAANTNDWYWVRMKDDEGGVPKALLPKPHPSTQAVDYYVQGAGMQASSSTNRTEMFHPTVATMTYCRNEAQTYRETADLEQIGIVIGLMQWGQSAVPTGFMPTNILSVVLPDGRLLSLAEALKPGATGSSASTTSSATATGGGGASGVWTTLAVVAGLGAAASLGGSGDGDGGGTPNPPSTPQPGTGDISFLLEWNSCADLDLYVRDPSGELIYFDHKTSASGGKLDIDANRNCQQTNCTSPKENVFWPAGRAPRGTFSFWVAMYSCGSASSSSYTIKVKRGTTTSATRTGTVTKGSQSQTFTYQY